jgi:hypothetical protein
MTQEHVEIIMKRNSECPQIFYSPDYATYLCEECCAERDAGDDTGEDWE